MRWLETHEPVDDERLPREAVCSACTQRGEDPVRVGSCVHAQAEVARVNRQAREARPVRRIVA